MRQEAKVGIFVLFAIVVFISFIFLLGNFSFGKYYKFYILFSNVSGLPRKAPIKVSGVTIGRIHSITLTSDGNAKVEAHIKKDVRIYRDAKASIVSTGIVGSKYLGLTVGSKDQDMIGDGDIIRGVDPYSMEEMIDKVFNSFSSFMKTFEALTGNGDVENSSLYKLLVNLENITEKLDKGFGEDEAKIASMIDNMNNSLASIKSISEKIDKGFGHDERDIRSIVVNLSSATKSISNIASDIESFLAENKDVLQEDVKKFSSVLASIEDVANKAGEFVDKLNSDKGPLAELISNEEMAKDVQESIKSVKETTENLKTITNRIGKIEVSWDAEMRYNIRDAKIRTDAGLRISPRPGKRYIFLVENISTDNTAKYDVGDQKFNSITALIEKDYKNFTGHAGLIRSSGGLGLKYRPFKNKKIDVGFDCYRFERTIGTEKIPWINFMASYQFIKWGRFNIATEDTLAYPGLTTSFKLIAQDEDIGYLFGLLGLAT